LEVRLPLHPRRLPASPRLSCLLPGGDKHHATHACLHPPAACGAPHQRWRHETEGRTCGRAEDFSLPAPTAHLLLHAPHGTGGSRALSCLHLTCLLYHHAIPVITRGGRFSTPCGAPARRTLTLALARRPPTTIAILILSFSIYQPLPHIPEDGALHLPALARPRVTFRHSSADLDGRYACLPRIALLLGSTPRRFAVTP